MSETIIVGPRGGRYTTRVCEACGQSFRFKIPAYEGARERGRFCSAKCANTGKRHTGDTKVCNVCRQEKPVSEFSVRNYGTYSAPYSRCRECSAGETQAYYRENREAVLSRVTKKAREQREQVIAHYSNGTNRCACCGESQYEFLAIDHINGGGYQQRKALKHGGSGIVPWLIKNGLPPGFQVLCHNCNMAKGFYGECPHERERRR